MFLTPSAQSSHGASGSSFLQVKSLWRTEIKVAWERERESYGLSARLTEEERKEKRGAEVDESRGGEGRGDCHGQIQQMFSCGRLVSAVV